MKRTLIVLNAGEASRLRPLTNNCSKAMIRVNGKPVIDYVLDVYGSRFTDLVVVQSPRLNDVEQYLSRHPRALATSYVTQPEPTGPRDALARALETIKNDGSVVVWYGDTLLFDWHGDKQLLDELPIGENFFATSTRIDDQSEWMMWDGESFHIKPTVPIKDARAVVGVFGFADVGQLRAATSIAYTYDLDRVLELVQGREVPVESWHDIGVPSRYHQTCAALLNSKARAFNNFRYDPDTNVLYKTARGSAMFTLETEANWYRGLAPHQMLFTPRLVPTTEPNVLGVSYESGTLLSDLYLYEELPLSFWTYALRRLVHIMRTNFHTRVTSMNFVSDFEHYSREMWHDGVRDRLVGVLSLDAGVKRYLLDVGERVIAASQPVQCMHGDLHLANVLYDAHNGRLTLIDPRGKYGRYVGCAGGDLYDWCKLAYDCYHGFSAIVAGREPSPVLREAFLIVAREARMPVDLVVDGAAVLMATGIPLHYDSPQRQAGFSAAVTAHYRERTRDAA